MFQFTVAASVSVVVGSGGVAAMNVAAWTNAVVAICVVFVLIAAVGAVGTPVNAGLSSPAFAVTAFSSV